MQYINDSMGASLVFVLMVPVVPTGTLPDGHTGSNLKIVDSELQQWWVPQLRTVAPTGVGTP